MKYSERASPGKQSRRWGCMNGVFAASSWLPMEFRLILLILKRIGPFQIRLKLSMKLKLRSEARC